MRNCPLRISACLSGILSLMACGHDRIPSSPPPPESYVEAPLRLDEVVALRKVPGVSVDVRKGPDAGSSGRWPNPGRWFVPDVWWATVARDGRVSYRAVFELDGRFRWAELRSSQGTLFIRPVESACLGKKVVVAISRSGPSGDGRRVPLQDALGPTVDLLYACESALSREADASERRFILREAWQDVPSRGFDLVIRHVSDPSESDHVRTGMISHACREEVDDHTRRRVLEAAAPGVGIDAAHEGLVCLEKRGLAAPGLERRFISVMVERSCAGQHGTFGLQQLERSGPGLAAVSDLVDACAEPGLRAWLRHVSGRPQTGAELSAALASRGEYPGRLAQRLDPDRLVDRAVLASALESTGDMWMASTILSKLSRAGGPPRPAELLAAARIYERGTREDEHSGVGRSALALFLRARGEREAAADALAWLEDRLARGGQPRPGRLAVALIVLGSETHVPAAVAATRGCRIEGSALLVNECGLVVAGLRMIGCTDQQIQRAAWRQRFGLAPALECARAATRG